MSEAEETAIESDVSPKSEKYSGEASELSWTECVRRVLANKNFTIFLITAWIYSAFNVIQRYFSLYYRDLGVTYTLIGVLGTLFATIALIGELIAGYLADNYDRKRLASITMGLNSLAYFILALAVDFWTIALAFVAFGLGMFTGRGGTAYIMEQIDRRYGGVAVSLFMMGTVLGLIPLFFFGVLLELEFTFILTMRVMCMVISVAYMVCTIIRLIALDPSPPQKRAEQSDNVLWDFISETKRGLGLLIKVFPVFILVMCVDALSDSFYGFASLFYVNETLAFGIGEINLMQLLTLLISVPLVLYLGRVFDKHGGRKLTIAVYSVMPISITLLLLAKYIPYVAPESWRVVLDGIYPGLSVILSLAFIATAMKSINDFLWMTVLNTYIQKSLPRKDLGKMLGLSTFMVLAVRTVAPLPAGFIYELFQGLPLLMTALFLNIIILSILVTKSIEPSIDVEELENDILE